MKRSWVGWLWVGAQAAILAALVLLPHRSDWATPDWVSGAGAVLIIAGLAMVIAASLGLGAALTPTPVPKATGKLTTSGFYQQVRHPIYTGVLAIVAGLTIRSGSWLHLAVAAVAIAFFDRKAAWEEARLAERYPDYPQYAARTPKFIPRPWKRRLA